MHLDPIDLKLEVLATLHCVKRYPWIQNLVIRTAPLFRTAQVTQAYSETPLALVALSV